MSIQITFTVADEIGGSASFTAYDHRVEGNGFIQVELTADEEVAAVDIPLEDIGELEDFLRERRVNFERAARAQVKAAS